jgi:predicted membrane chloride channel (bestrophin family)
MTIFYRPEGSNIRALFTWRGTIFEAVLYGNWDLYFFMAVHCGGLLLLYTDITGALGLRARAWLSEHSYEIMNSITLPGTLFIFLVIFYNGHCYERYKHYVNSAMDLSRLIINYSHEVANAFGPESDEARNICRLMQASLMLCYQEIASSIDYSALQKQKLLHRKEISLLKQCHSDQCVMTGSWVLEILHRNVLNGGLHPMQFKVLRDSANVIQIKMCSQFDIEDVPIPFSYYHALNAISMIFLTVISGATPFMNFGTMLQLMFVPVILGIKEVASQLSNPFGNNKGDFPLSELILRNNIVCRSFFLKLGTETACCQQPKLDDEEDGTRFSDGWLAEEAEERDMIELESWDHALFSDMISELELFGSEDARTGLKKGTHKQQHAMDHRRAKKGTNCIVSFGSNPAIRKRKGHMQSRRWQAHHAGHGGSSDRREETLVEEEQKIQV